MGEFEHRDVESCCNASQQLAHGAFHVVSAERGPHLDLDEDACQLGPAFAGSRQDRELGCQVEAGLFTGGEMFDRCTHLGRIESQVRHHRSCRCDFTLRDPTVGLGKVPHHAECPTEEALTDRGKAVGSAQARIFRRAAGLLVELVSQQQPYGRADRSPGEQPESAADHFARPLHHHCYSTKRRRRGR